MFFSPCNFTVSGLSNVCVSSNIVRGIPLSVIELSTLTSSNDRYEIMSLLLSLSSPYVIDVSKSLDKLDIKVSIPILIGSNISTFSYVPNNCVVGHQWSPVFPPVTPFKSSPSSPPY